MSLDDAVKGVPGFTSLNHAEKIRFFCWYLTRYANKSPFFPADVARCFSELHIAGPADIGSFFRSMVQSKALVKTKSGYVLERTLRDDFDNRYGKREATVLVDKLLSGLPDKIPEVDEQEYLREALKCFRATAYRAAIVMTWNVAFSHLTGWTFSKHLGAFNTQLGVSYPKEKSIVKPEDFLLLKEDQVLTVCKSANLLTVNRHKVFKQKLDKRNTAAHPSSDIEIGQLTAEEYIKDLVENGILKLT